MNSGTILPPGASVGLEPLPHVLVLPHTDVSDPAACSDIIDVPLLLFLHGAHGRSDVLDLGALLASAPVREATAAGFALLAPQAPRTPPASSRRGTRAPRTTEWAMPGVVEQVMRVLYRTMESPHVAPAAEETNGANSVRIRIDPTQVFVMGMSMGGLGAYMIAARSPGTFAAAVPMCGGGKPVFARLLVRTPMWFFHSRDDVCVPFADTAAVVEALQSAAREAKGDMLHDGNAQSAMQAGDAPGDGSMPPPPPVTSSVHGGVRFTVYERSPAPSSFPTCSWMTGHDCWTEAYATPELWSWLARQRGAKDRVEAARARWQKS
jgi:predicted peptidase